MTASPPTRFELEGGVATITLDRNEERNALSAALMDSLGDDLERAAEETSCRVVVLTNAGSAFCAGANLKGGDETPRHSLPELLSLVLEHPKPVVGRIAGHCMGGGVGLAAACDVSVVSDSARFGFREVRVGVAPAVISVVCLPKMRAGDALELFLTGEQVSAERAREVGLVNHVVAAEGLDEKVGEIVSLILQGAPGALAASKRLVHEVPGLPREEAFARTARLSAELFSSEEGREGRAAFAARRPPAWVPGGSGS